MWLTCGSRELFQQVHVEVLHAVRVEVVELGLLLRAAEQIPEIHEQRSTARHGERRGETHQHL